MASALQVVYMHDRKVLKRESMQVAHWHQEKRGLAPQERLRLRLDDRPYLFSGFNPAAQEIIRLFRSEGESVCNRPTGSNFRRLLTRKLEQADERPQMAESCQLILMGLSDCFSSKSGSAPISRILLRHLRAMTAIPLGRTLPHASSTLPAGSAGHTSTPAYLGLLQVEIARFTLHKLPCADSSLLL